MRPLHGCVIGSIGAIVTRAVCVDIGLVGHDLNLAVEGCALFEK